MRRRDFLAWATTAAGLFVPATRTIFDMGRGLRSGGVVEAEGLARLSGDVTYVLSGDAIYVPGIRAAPGSYLFEAVPAGHRIVSVHRELEEHSGGLDLRPLDFHSNGSDIRVSDMTAGSEVAWLRIENLAGGDDDKADE